jgi:hypothetical protein
MHAKRAFNRMENLLIGDLLNHQIERKPTEQLKILATDLRVQEKSALVECDLSEHSSHSQKQKPSY